MTTDTLDEIQEAPVDSKPELQLTKDQEEALVKFRIFLMDPTETVFVLSGYSGCGKTTLVEHILDRLPSISKAAKLINPSMPEYATQLTATTNKAAENLSKMTGHPVATIHSFLGLRVQTDYRANTTTLIPRQMDKHENVLLFIDEASYIDSELLNWIFNRTERSKIVFIGDPAQLTPVKSTNTPVFEANFSGAALTEVVRQAKGNPIVDLSTKFRETVNTGNFFSFKPDGHYIRLLDRDAFNKAVAQEFTRTDWRYADSKVLAWTNKCVVGYNQYVRNLAKGDPHFQVGDYAVCNSFLSVNRTTIKTDQLVQITRIEEDHTRFGVEGNYMQLDYVVRVFQPKSLAAKNEAIKQYRKEGRMDGVVEMESQWSDLRGAYACTINKSQGSTFGSVFIDLDDVSRCNNGNQIARMLYVAVSRAKNHVFLTGDLA